ncbi:hypothetical protein M434DRAFT_12872 [Hypoxylon sp. CO27-5]|nr:hypothetical protein M434DRAFT_12872 [Hypoxylon sp. CO27-5]
MSLYHPLGLLHQARIDDKQTWGFFIYRTTYDDQALWERYLVYLKATMMAAFEPWSDPPAAELSVCITLQSRFKFITKKDEENLEGALELHQSWRVDAARGGREPNYTDEEVVVMVVEAQGIHWNNHSYEEEDEEDDDDDEGKEWQYMLVP